MDISHFFFIFLPSQIWFTTDLRRCTQWFGVPTVERRSKRLGFVLKTIHFGQGWFSILPQNSTFDQKWRAMDALNDEAWDTVQMKHFFNSGKRILLQKMRNFVFFIRGTVRKSVRKSSNVLFFEIWSYLLWSTMISHNPAVVHPKLFQIYWWELHFKFHKLFYSAPKMKVKFS